MKRTFVVIFALLWSFDSLADPSTSPSTRPATRPALPVDHDESRLSYVNELALVHAGTVHILSDGMMIHRLTDDGGEYDDRHFIDGDTAKIVDNPKARRADEITLKVGERCMVGGHNVWLDLRLLRIEHDRAVFQREEVRRNGETIKDVISIAAYRVGP